MSQSVKSYFSSRVPLVDAHLKKIFKGLPAKPRRLKEAMAYSVFAGGKRLRPILVMAAAEACGFSGKKTLPTACAFEMLHTYSLIHDDLPSMDDDDLRRGRPTNHKVFGEDMAILAGDSLLTHAFQAVLNNGSENGIPAPRILSALEALIKGGGAAGMIGGQVADIEADKGRWRQKKLEFKTPEKLLHYIHAHKTAALIQASLVAGGSLAGANRKKLKALDQYGLKIGLAFQVADDILDRVGNKKKLGKRGSDLKNDKLTFVALYGLDGARRRGQAYVRQAKAALKPFGRRGLFLSDLADYILSRDH